MTAAPAPEADAEDLDPAEARELRKLLKQRDKDEEKRLRQEVADIDPGDLCPVCQTDDKGPRLEATKFPEQLTPFLRRKGFSCPECQLKAQPAPNNVGYALALVISIACALGGMSAIFTAQRMSDPTERLYTFAAGALLFAGGLFLGQGAQGAGSNALLAQKVARGRRRRLADEASQTRKLSKQERTEQRKRAAVAAEQAWAAENLEAVVVAIILALIIRHFAMEAFVIPTGSMAPTLFGDHFYVDCPNCGYTFARGKSDNDFGHDRDHPDQASISSDCPVCDEDFTVTKTTADVTDGDKIVVNKFAYVFGEPQRYDVVVFKYPVEPWKNFIKRLIGLPGETIKILNGDVFADGVLQRKPDHVQDAVWLPVYDARYPRKDREHAPPFWLVRNDLAGTGEWNLDDESALICTPAGDVGPWLEHDSQRILRDHYGYNGYRSIDGEPIADLRVQAKVVSAGGTIRLGINEDERKVWVRVPVGDADGTYEVFVDGQSQHKHQGPAVRPGIPTQVCVAYADDRLRLIVDGETRFDWLDEHAPGFTGNKGTVLLGAGGQPATFQGVRIDRDIYYVSNNGTYDPSEKDVAVPEGQYFCMGDNSPNSEDGRRWGFVDEDHMVGRAFMVFWPLLPARVKLIR